jgi:hypothetical protein
MAQEQSAVFQQLKRFLTQQMRMSHLYQPLMLKAPRTVRSNAICGSWNIRAVLLRASQTNKAAPVSPRQRSLVGFLVPSLCR